MASLEKRYGGRYRIVFCWQGERRYHEEAAAGDGRGLIQAGLLACRRRYVDEQLRWLMNTAHVFGDEGDDRIRKALVVPVILDDEHRADFGPAPVSVRVIKEDDITALHGFRS